MSFSDAISEINETHFLYSGALEKSLDWNEYITLHQSNFKRGNRQTNKQMQLQKIHLNGSNVSFMSYSRKQKQHKETMIQWSTNTTIKCLCLFSIILTINNATLLILEFGLSYLSEGCLPSALFIRHRLKACSLK